MSRFSCSQIWLACSTAALLAPCGCSPQAAKPAMTNLTGSLNVLVRPPDRTIEPQPLSESTLPVVSGGAMVIDVELGEPAFIYLVWINSEGQIRPLYPWNNETLEVTDIHQPPPERRATKRIFSPLLGKSWTFGNHGGTETVILLARRTALPPDIRFAQLILSPPPVTITDANELATMNIRPSENPPGSADFTMNIKLFNPALNSFLAPLRKHFDLIDFVQFNHEEPKAD